MLTEGCFRQIEYAGILKGTADESAAKELIDFLLGVRTQEDIPLNMFVFPANEDAALPEVFVQHTTLPDQPITMAPDRIEENRERWITEWAAIVR